MSNEYSVHIHVCIYIYIYTHVLCTYTHMILRCYAGRGSRSARASTAAGQPRPISCNVTYAHTLSTSYIVSLYTLSIHLGRERERGRERGREGGWEGGRERERERDHMAAMRVYCTVAVAVMMAHA